MTADPTRQRIDALVALNGEELGRDVVELVRNCLADRSAAVVSKAAKTAAAQGLHELRPDIVRRLEGLLDAPAARDKGCIAKTALVDALAEFGDADPDVFLGAARHVQMEAVYGGRVDTGGELRAAAASALFRAGYRDILFVFVALLADAEPVCRRAAIEGLEKLGTESCELLLRLHVLHGEPDPALAGACLAALMRIAPGRSEDFVAPFLSGEDELLAEGAALALGESRAAGALDALMGAWERRVGQPLRERLMLPIALTKEDRAYEFLMEQLAGAAPALAESALRALKVFDDWGERRDAMREAVKERGESALRDVWFDEFGEELA